MSGFLDALLGGIKQVQTDGTALPLEPALNFTGSGVTVSDDPTNSRTTVTITGGGGGSGGIGIIASDPPYNVSSAASDNQAGILAAIAAANGGRVYLPAGILKTSPIDLSAIPSIGRADGLNLIGAGQAAPGQTVGGTVLRAVGSQAFTLKVAALNVQLQDLCIDGGGFTTTAALRFEYITNNTLIKNVNVTGAHRNALDESLGADLIGMGYDGNNLEVDNVRFENCRIFQSFSNADNCRHAVHIQGSNIFKVTFANCGIGQGYYLVYMTGGSASFTEDTQFYSHAFGGIVIAGSCVAFKLDNCYSEFVTTNFFSTLGPNPSAVAQPINFYNNLFNANIELNIASNQPVNFFGNSFKGNVNLATGAMPVFAQGNVFSNSANYTGDTSKLVQNDVFLT